MTDSQAADIIRNPFRDDCVTQDDFAHAMRLGAVALEERAGLLRAVIEVQRALEEARIDFSRLRAAIEEVHPS